MKASTLSLVLAAVLPLAPAAVRAQNAEKETPAALRTSAGEYITAGANGGIDLSGKSVTSKQVFVIVDLNGGELADGDTVKIKYQPGLTADAGKNKPSFWKEEGGKVYRVNTATADTADGFKLKRKGDAFALQTASGKFVAPPVITDGLGVADAISQALMITVEKNPAPQN